MKEKEKVEEDQKEAEAESDSCGSFSGCKNCGHHRVNFMNK